MKDVELIAELIARDAATACAARIMRGHVERHPVNSLPQAEAVLWLRGMETRHMTRALEGLAANRRDLELFMSMPPINPS